MLYYIAMIQGFSGLDEDRLTVCLGRLLPHLDLHAVALTGGVGMQVGLAALGQAPRRNGVADVDFVASSLDAIERGAVGPFLVSHYHVAGPGVRKFLVQLVDPVSRLRIDIFPDLAGSIANARMTAIQAHQVPVLPLDSIFAHKLQTLSQASAGRPIDPKHLQDAWILGTALRRNVPPVAPESLAPDVCGADDDGECDRCELSRSDDWPLAPKEQIRELICSHNP